MASVSQSVGTPGHRKLGNGYRCGMTLPFFDPADVKAAALDCETNARTIVFADHGEQEMHVAAVGSTFRRLGSIGSPHLAQLPYVPSDIRFRAASI